MTSPSTPPGRAWPDRASVALAAALVLIGAGTLAGWWMRSDELLQPFPGTAALKINEAAGIWILGLVFLAIEFGRRNLAFLAVIPALIALITLAEEVLQRDLPIDEFFGRDHLLVGAAHPGRMSATAAACLLLGGLALLWRAIDRAGRPRLFAEAVSGSLLVSAGFSTLLGYAAGLPTVYSWGTATATAPVGAIAAFLLGGALILLAWRDRTATDGEPPAWTPMPAVMLCLTLTAILWIGLRERERTYLGSKSKNAINLVATEFSRVLDSQTNHLERMARRWGDGPDRAFSGWDTDAKAYLADARELGTDTLAFVNPAGRTVWIYPAEGNESAANFNHTSVDERRAAFENARTSGGPVVSATTKIRTRKSLEPGAVIYAPVFRAGAFTGCVAVEFDYLRVFRNITAIRLKLDANYHISISVAQDIVYFSAAADPSRHEDLIVERSFTVAGRPLRISIVPSDTAVAEEIGRAHV